ncbi:MAG: PQQ-binding-like beta-propeller repeat protein, partial [Pirellulaceae bacterium]|nr:PQQ-binding-like beta-propeller repeat protein [Pirellulaceae bacterium]
MNQRSFVFAGSVLGGFALLGGLALISAQAAAPSTTKSQLDLAKVEAQKGDWSRWRGPNGDGVSAEKGLLAEWSDDGPPLAWQGKGFGAGFSSVAVSGGKIFTLGHKDGKCCLIAADVKDGKVLWTTPFGGGGPNCTPTVDGNLVFGVSNEGELACCDTKSGRVLWSHSFPKDFGG